MDIDIDFSGTFNPNSLFKKAVPASMIKNNDILKHPCGYYLQNMAIDELTGLAAIPYEEAEVVGYFKIDFLHINVLDNFKSKTEIRQLVKKEPNWDLLLDEKIVSTLFQIGKQFNIISQVKPRSIQELADVVAMIRPAKRQLLGEYLINRDNTRNKLYRQGLDDKSSFKKGHAIAYSLTIVLQLHLIERNML